MASFGIQLIMLVLPTIAKEIPKNVPGNGVKNCPAPSPKIMPSKEIVKGLSGVTLS